jgi:trehalose 6-phosphate phosphatase
MHYLLSAAGKRTLERLASSNATLYAFDFDGTLARIVRDRNAARMAEGVRLSLGELTAKAPTAIVSGRSLEDLRPRVEGAATFLIGNHGMQGIKAPPRMLHQAHDLCRLWIEELGRLEEEFAAAGIGMEDKIYSLTLHYRQSKRPEIAREVALKAAAALVPAPRLIFGKAVVNVIPPGTPHKGSALQALMDRLRSPAALYVGDDDTDEDVFALADERIVSVRVGRKAGSAARYYLRQQPQIAWLLEHLLDLYAQKGDEENRAAEA